MEKTILIHKERTASIKEPTPTTNAETKSFFNIKVLTMSIALSMTTCFVIMYNEGASVPTLILLSLVFVFLVNIFYELNVVWRFLFFNEKKLAPTKGLADEDCPTVAVVIPSCNEPLCVAKMTLDSALAIDYPSHKLSIIVVDNSDEDHQDYPPWKRYVEGLQKNIGVDVKFIHRRGREGFKPRNIDIALSHVYADYVMFLDVDSTLPRDALRKPMSSFLNNPRLGFVQLQTIPTNVKDSSNLALAEGIKCYMQRFILGLNMHGGHMMFYGHNAIWRKTAIDQMGDTLEYHNGQIVVAEDFSMSVRTVLAGFHGKSVWLQSGEWVPASLRETEAMWLRWTVGAYQVFSKHLSSAANLNKFPLFEKLGWVQHMCTFVNYGLLPFYFLAGLAFQSTPLLYLAGLSMLPPLVMVIGAYRKLSLGGMGKIKKMIHCYMANMVVDGFITWVRSKGMVRYLINSRHGWKPTGKATEGKILWTEVLRDQGGLLCYSLVCTGLSGLFLLDSHNTLYELGAYGMALVFSLNLLLAVVVYGKDRMSVETEAMVKNGSIDDYNDYY